MPNMLGMFIKAASAQLRLLRSNSDENSLQSFVPWGMLGFMDGSEDELPSLCSGNSSILMIKLCYFFNQISYHDAKGKVGSHLPWNPRGMNSGKRCWLILSKFWESQSQTKLSDPRFTILSRYRLSPTLIGAGSLNRAFGS